MQFNSITSIAWWTWQVAVVTWTFSLKVVTLVLPNQDHVVAFCSLLSAEIESLATKKRNQNYRKSIKSSWSLWSLFLLSLPSIMDFSNFTNIVVHQEFWNLWIWSTVLFYVPAVARHDLQSLCKVCRWANWIRKNLKCEIAEKAMILSD